VTSRFGRRLYDAFFRSYTEKIWGIPGSEIKSQWAAQRIRNFSLGKAITNLLGISRAPVTTLIEEFQYPRCGPGQLWESLRDRVEEMGIPVHLGERCVSLGHDGRRVRTIVLEGEEGRRELPVEGVLSSIPLNELVLSLDPPPPTPVAAAARRLRYRDLCIVALMTTQAEPFPDNWIYLHDPRTRAGRVQNFGAWSPAMVRPGTTCLGVEYFCFKGDEIWELSNEEAVELAKSELAVIGLIDPQHVFGGTMIRVANAYPMYDTAYPVAVDILREYLARFENLETFGRNGLHRYNNQDHSMWTAVLATVNLLEQASHDVWSVNTEAEYLEEGDLTDAILEAELLGAPVHHPGAARTRELATRS
jgi:protoporphyrinogen oxidase